MRAKLQCLTGEGKLGRLARIIGNFRKTKGLENWYSILYTPILREKKWFMNCDPLLAL